MEAPATPLVARQRAAPDGACTVTEVGTCVALCEATARFATEHLIAGVGVPEVKAMAAPIPKVSLGTAAAATSGAGAGGVHA